MFFDPVGVRLKTRLAVGLRGTACEAVLHQPTGCKTGSHPVSPEPISPSHLLAHPYSLNLLRFAKHSSLDGVGRFATRHSSIRVFSPRSPKGSLLLEMFFHRVEFGFHRMELFLQGMEFFFRDGRTYQNTESTDQQGSLQKIGRVGVANPRIGSGGRVANPSYPCALPIRRDHIPSPFRASVASCSIFSVPASPRPHCPAAKSTIEPLIAAPIAYARRRWQEAGAVPLPPRRKAGREGAGPQHRQQRQERR